jgi:hypothetical protein
LTKGGEGGFKDWKRQGNVAMTLLLKSIKDPARLQWYEVCPERRLNAAERVKKVDHYYLSIDAVTQPMQVREGGVPYGDREKG